MVNKNKEIAVMILGPLGDVINSSGVFRTLKKAYPDNPLSIITIPAGVTASYGIPEITNRYLFDRSKKGLKGLFEIWKFAFANHGKFDTIVILDTSFRSAHLAFMTGAKRRIGRRCNFRTPLLTGSIPFTKEEKNNVYVAEYYARCLKPLGLYKENIEPSFSYTKEDETRITEILKEHNLQGKKLLGFCPACGQKIKTMQAEDAAEFIDLVNKKGDYKIVITGGSDISDFASRLKELCKTEFTDLTGKTKYGETAALIDKCSKFVSVDTSCQHLAIALKTPVVSLFFSRLYSKWGPADLKYNRLLVNQTDKHISAEKIYENLTELTDKKVIEVNCR